MATQQEMERLEAELREIRRLVTEQGIRVARVAVNMDEAAQMLGCSARHISRMVKRGTLTLKDLDGVRRIPVSEIHALLDGPRMESSGATPERVKYDAAAASRKLAELRKRR